MSSSVFASTVQSKAIKSIADINTSVKQGDKYSLPATVTAVMSDNTKQQIAVAWTIDTGNSKQDIYIFEGTVSGYGKKVKLTVTAQKYIKSIADIKVSVTQKYNYTLPSTVTAVMNDGSVRQAAVTWNPSKADTSKPGTFKFQGTVQGYSSKAILTLTVTQDQEMGNTGGNITNGGIAMQKGDWIYYMNGGDYNKLYKININGTGKTKLNNDASYNINVVGDWIYFTNKSDGQKLYKIKTDGTGKAKLSNDEGNSINVVGNWIYYLSGTIGNYSINKIKIDGTGKTQLNNYPSEVMNVSGDWIYYLGKNDNCIYKIKIDGTGNALLLKGWYENLIVMGDWIYFKDRYDYNVYKIKTNGTGKIKIINDSCNTFNVSGDWIYYANYSDEHLYKVKTDGTGRTFLDSDWCQNINIAGSWIYYASYWDWNTYYRMKTDGSNKQIIN